MDTWRIYVFAHPIALGNPPGPSAYVGITQRADILTRIKEDIRSGRGPRSTLLKDGPIYRELPAPLPVRAKSDAEWWEQEWWRRFIVDGWLVDGAFGTRWKRNRRLLTQ